MSTSVSHFMLPPNRTSWIADDPWNASCKIGADRVFQLEMRDGKDRRCITCPFTTLDDRTFLQRLQVEIGFTLCRTDSLPQV